MKTLIIDNYDSFTYNLYQECAALGAHPVVRRNDQVSLDDIARMRFSHIVLSPGPGSPENKKDFGICSEVITTFSGKIPILGVCLGHQGIIHSMGGSVIRAPLPMHGKRSQILIQQDHPLFRGLPKKIEGMRYHSLVGERKTLPGDLTVIAETEKSGGAQPLIMGVSHRSHALFGLQFHPESVGTPEGKIILKNFLSIKNGVLSGNDEKSPSADAAEQIIHDIASGKMNDEEIELFLRDSAHRKVTVDELTGMARGLRAHALRLPFVSDQLMDTCGTGGSGLPRMNMSTTAAFVLRACGVNIAKHGNRAMSGRCGSFDLLEALGVPIELNAHLVSACLKEQGIAFLYAPLFHPVMKRIGPIRKKLGFPTVFNLLGPLINPALPQYHMLGTTSRENAEKIIRVMKNLGYRRALVVTGEDGIDDVCVTGKTYCYELSNGEISSFEIRPEIVGLPRAKTFDGLDGACSAARNAKLFLKLLSGEGPAPVMQQLLLSSGCGLYVAGIAKGIAEGIFLADRAIREGLVYEKFRAYKTLTKKFYASEN